MEYRVIKFRNSDETYIVSNDFSDMCYHYTYAQYGQPLSPEDASDWTHNNSECNFCKYCIKEVSKNKNFAETIKKIKDEFDYSDYELVQAFKGNADYPLEGFFDEELEKEISKWVEENENDTMCTAMNYWDGSNWASIVVDCDLDDAIDADFIDEEEESEIIYQYETDTDWENWNQGDRRGESEDYVFTESQWQGSFGVLVEKK